MWRLRINTMQMDAEDSGCKLRMTLWKPPKTPHNHTVERLLSDLCTIISCPPASSLLGSIQIGLHNRIFTLLVAIVFALLSPKTDILFWSTRGQPLLVGSLTACDVSPKSSSERFLKAATRPIAGLPCLTLPVDIARYLSPAICHFLKVLAYGQSFGKAMCTRLQTDLKALE